MMSDDSGMTEHRMRELASYYVGRFVGCLTAREALTSAETAHALFLLAEIASEHREEYLPDMSAKPHLRNLSREETDGH